MMPKGLQNEMRAKRTHHDSDGYAAQVKRAELFREKSSAKHGDKSRAFASIGFEPSCRAFACILRIGGLAHHPLECEMPARGWESVNVERDEQKNDIVGAVKTAKSASVREFRSWCLSGHPEPNQEPADTYRVLPSDALPTELQPPSGSVRG